MKAKAKKKLSTRERAKKWRVTFIDPVTAGRIEVDVYAPDIVAARERGWAALRATRPPGLVVLELVDARPADAREPRPSEGGR